MFPVASCIVIKELESESLKTSTNSRRTNTGAYSGISFSHSPSSQGVSKMSGRAKKSIRKYENFDDFRTRRCM